MLNVPYNSVNIRQYTHWPDYELKHVGTSRGQWFAADVRAGIYVNIGPCGFAAGYIISNFDVYSQYRYLSDRGISFSKYYPRHPLLQGAHLTASHCF